MKKHQVAFSSGRYLSLGNYRWVFVPSTPSSEERETEDRDKSLPTEADTCVPSKQTEEQEVTTLVKTK